jgi:hypothetical protein
VQVDYNVVHFQTSLVQLFILLLQTFEKALKMIELKRFEGAPNGYPFAPLLSCKQKGWSDIVVVYGIGTAVLLTQPVA